MRILLSRGLTTRKAMGEGAWTVWPSAVWVMSLRPPACISVPAPPDARQVPPPDPRTRPRLPPPRPRPLPIPHNSIVRLPSSPSSVPLSPATTQLSTSLALAHAQRHSTAFRKMLSKVSAPAHTQRCVADMMLTTGLFTVPSANHGAAHPSGPLIYHLIPPVQLPCHLQPQYFCCRATRGELGENVYVCLYAIIEPYALWRQDCFLRRAIV